MTELSQVKDKTGAPPPPPLWLRQINLSISNFDFYCSAPPSRFTLTLFKSLERKTFYLLVVGGAVVRSNSFHDLSTILTDSVIGLLSEESPLIDSDQTY